MHTNLAASASAEGCQTLFDADGDNTAQVCKAGPGNLYGLHVYNPNATTNYFIQFFDVAAGSVTVGTTTPKLSIHVAGAGSRDIHFPAPIQFDTAITYACTTTATGNTDPATGFTVNLLYR